MLSLEKQCLNTIVSNFESFYNAYVDSKDSIPQKHFEFLQRRYSDQLATALFESGTIEGIYFEFLINEHLKCFDDVWFTDCYYIIANGDVFRRLPNLRIIRFKRCTDEILKKVAKFCSKVVEIDVRCCIVTDEGVTSLCKLRNGVVSCPELKKILLRNSFATDRGVKRLIQRLPLLECIDYPKTAMLLCSIHEENLAKTNDFHYFNLTELFIFHFDSLDQYAYLLQTCLALCPKLESLHCFISDNSQFQWFTGTHLKKVEFNFLRPKEFSTLDNFLEMNASNLTSLSVVNCRICVPSLAVHCPVLKEFSASHSTFTDDDDCQLLMPSLTKCCFQTIDASSAKAIGLFISISPKLEFLSFINCEMFFDVKDHILFWCQKPSAKKIHFANVYLDKRFLSNILSKCRSLEEMSLFKCNTDRWQEGLQDLAKSLPNKPKIFFDRYDTLEKVVPLHRF